LFTVFLFAISGMYYFEAVAVPKTSIATKLQLKRKGDLLFLISLLIATGEPALILFTLPNLTVVAVIATVLWTLYASFLVRQGRKLRAD
jgi:hypothetical protein